MGLVRAVKPCAVGAREPKPASEFTKAVNKRVLETLPFNDRTDFEDARRGFIAGLPGDAIKDVQGKTILDLKTLQVPADAPAPETMNPSLWRVAQLNSFSGLFKLVDRLYQVRNIDITNITFIEGETGIIVIDPCVSTHAARAALDLYFAHRARKPVTAVIYTHSHIDHFARVAAVTSVEDVAAGKTKIIAPAGFTEEAVSENIYAGNAMIRRVMYMAGNPLKTGYGAGQTLVQLDEPEEVDALWSKIKDRVEVVYAPADFAYGMHEFGIRDDSGYGLAFGSKVSTSQPKLPSGPDRSDA